MKSFPIKFLIALLVVLLVLVAGVVGYLVVGKFVLGTLHTGQWANCTDVREVIKEGSREYVACYGGILVLENGKVIDQITMAQGLGNEVATSLVKKGDVLYIGTQDGLTIFNLETREAKKISVAEGLPSGANVEVREDGDYVWAATFSGIARYDTRNGKLETFANDPVVSKKPNITELLVMPNGVYAVVVASPYYIIRFDKATSTWKAYPSTPFVENSVGSTFFSGLYKVGNYVYTSVDKGVWQIEDSKDASWAKNAAVAGFATSFLSKPNTRIQLMGQSGSFLAFVLYPDNIKYYFEAPVGKVRYLTSATDPVLRGLQDGRQEKSVEINGRPKDFSKILAKIQDELLISSKSDIWAFNVKTGAFRRFHEGDVEVTLTPIEGGSKIFFTSQKCGMACTKPVFALVNYPDGSDEKLEPPSEVESGTYTSVASGSFGASLYKNYGQLSVAQFKDGKVEVSIPSFGKEVQFDPESKTWSLESYTPLESESNASLLVSCQPRAYYSFAAGKFGYEAVGCSHKAVVGNATYYWNDESQKLIKSVIGSSPELIDVTVAPASYSPFEDFYSKILVNGIESRAGIVYLATERGISAFDTKKNSWRVYTTKDGLVSNTVQSFVVANGYIAAVSNGGFALIKE